MSPVASPELHRAVERKQLIEGSCIHVSELLYYLDGDRFLNKQQAAEFLGGISIRTLEGWKVPHYKPRGIVLYRKRDLIAFMEQFRQQSAYEIDSIVKSVLREAEKRQK